MVWEGGGWGADGDFSRPSRAHPLSTRFVIRLTGGSRCCAPSPPANGFRPSGAGELQGGAVSSVTVSRNPGFRPSGAGELQGGGRGLGWGERHHSESDEYCTANEADPRPGGAKEGSRGWSEAWRAGTPGPELTKRVAKECALEGREKRPRTGTSAPPSLRQRRPADGARVFNSPHFPNAHEGPPRPRSLPGSAGARLTVPSHGLSLDITLMTLHTFKNRLQTESLGAT